MQLATAIAYSALFIAVLIASGHAQGQPKADAGAGASATASAMTIQARLEAREAQRRTALAEHRKRKEEFARRCGSEPMSPAQLEACRAAYRRL